MQNFDPDTEELRIEAESTCGIFKKWNDRLGHFPWHELVDELAARLRPGVLRLGHCFESLEQDESGVRVTCLDAATGEKTTVSAAVAVGCDGNQSSVRAALLRDGAPHYAGLGVWRGQCQKPEGWDEKYGRNLLTGWARGQALRARLDEVHRRRGDPPRGRGQAGSVPERVRGEEEEMFFNLFFLVASSSSFFHSFDSKTSEREREGAQRGRRQRQNKRRKWLGASL